MKKIKLLFATAALMLGGSVWAQTDVTSTYLTNADFSQGPTMTVNIHTYNKDITGSNVAQMQSVDGWTIVNNGDARASGVFTYGDGLFVGGSDYTTPSADSNGNTSGKALGMVAVWQADLQYTQDVSSSLPVGHYTLTFPVYNSVGGTTAINANYFGFIEDNGTTHYASEKTFTVNAWTTMTVSFDLSVATSGKISVGYKSTNSGSGSMPHLFLDGVTITYTDPLQASKDALQAEIELVTSSEYATELASAIATAQDVLDNATTEEELTNAKTTLHDVYLRYKNGLTSATAAAPVVTDFVVNGTFDSGISPWQRTGTYQNNQTANNKQGAFTGNFYENWNGSAQVNKMYQTISNIPNGTYRLDIAAFVNTLADPNESQYVFANSDKVYLTTGEPTAYEVWTVVSTNSVEIGLEQTTATANWMGIDNVSLRYYGIGDVISDAQNASHKLAWEEAKTAAEAAVANGDYANVTGSEKTALQTEIAKDEPTTAAGYDEAAAALISATSTFTAAKPAYDALVTEIAYAKTLNVSTTAAEAALNAEATATTVTAATQALKVLEYTSLNTNYPNDVTTSLLGTWVTGNYGTTSGQGYSSDETYYDKWNGSAMDLSSSKTVSLPEGSYVVRVAGRGVSSTTMNLSVKVGDAEAISTPFLMTGDTGKGIDTSGATNFSNEGTYSNNNDGRGWQYRYIKFTTDGTGDVVITINGHLEGNTWQSFYAPVLLCDNTTAGSIYAGTTEYSALNDAISDAEAKTLGFENGQYAPYNNVAAIEALAAAKAIDQTAELTNFKTDVVAATTALTNATWTANSGDVDAIYNGLFATVAEGQNYPNGWTRTNGWGQMRSEIEGTYATAYYNQPGSLQYGNQGVYTMPLAANTAYKLTFSYRSHENNSNNGVTASVLNGENGLPATKFAGNGSTSAWKTVSAYFYTGATAGNYVLTLANDGNTWMTNVSLVKADALVFADNAEMPVYTPGTYPTVKITRTLTANRWATAIYPFAVSGVDEIAVLNSYDASNGVIGFTSAAASTANEPFLMRSTAGATEITLTNVEVAAANATDATAGKASLKGAYTATDITNAEKNYVLSNNKIYSVGTAGATISPYRAYIQIDQSSEVKALSFFINGDDATGINAIDNGELTIDNAAIYNLAGQRLNKMQKGINIINGRKVLY